MRHVEVAARVSNELGEAPVWCEARQALYWVDIRAPALWRLSASGQLDMPMPEFCGALVLAADGRLAVGLLSRVVLFDPATAECRPFVDVEPPSRGNRLNEAKCDGAGRLWIGSMRDFGAATTGALYRVEVTGEHPAVTRVLSDVTIPNAMAWSPDGRTMYFADTGDGQIRAYDFDSEQGALGRMRVLVEAGQVPGKPDGVAVDEDGCLWNARYGGGCVVRITPRGEIDHTVELPVSQPTSCAFGGPDLRTLYVTSARQRLSQAELTAQPLAGALLAVNVGVRGLAVSRLRTA